MKARIHSLESMSTGDGPGLHFITFFQGCPLECKFYHNRDTRNPEGGNFIEMGDL